MKQFLFSCHFQKYSTTGEKLYKKVDFLFSKQQFEWSDSMSISTDDTLSMMGSKKGFISFMIKKNKNILVVHCLLHKKILTAKEMQDNQKDFVW